MALSNISIGDFVKAHFRYRSVMMNMKFKALQLVGIWPTQLFKITFEVAGSENGLRPKGFSLDYAAQTMFLI
jgi:hypothetical protein